MSHITTLIEKLQQSNFINQLKHLYGSDEKTVQHQTKRYTGLLSGFGNTFPGTGPVSLFSAPGRTEVGGNHTDHNAGRVLAAAVDIDIITALAQNDRNEIVIESSGFKRYTVDLDNLSPAESEENTSEALIRGVCARMKALGYEIGGFDAYMMSSVPNGSGLSSSAAFEVLVATVLNHLYNSGAISGLQCAQISQYAEIHYFGKPCGLMDQATSAVGGFVTFDFKDDENPTVRKVAYDFTSSGYSLVVVNTGGSHADLTGDYASIKNEMKAVAEFFGGDVLRGLSRERVLENTAGLRAKTSDRAILRALHFFADNQRVVDQVAALENDDFPAFLQLVNDSGASSWMLLQNCYTTVNASEQPVSLALAVSESMLKGHGAWRVHGGGFAGTIQAYVPHDMIDDYFSRMQAIFGDDSCHALNVRPEGSVMIDI